MVQSVLYGVGIFARVMRDFERGQSKYESRHSLARHGSMFLQGQIDHLSDGTLGKTAVDVDVVRQRTR